MNFFSVDTLSPICYHLAMKNIALVLKELTNKYLTKETLAGKMGVSTRTIDRWQENETKPSYAERKLLVQILTGYQNAENQESKK